MIIFASSSPRRIFRSAAACAALLSSFALGACSGDDSMPGTTSDAGADGSNPRPSNDDAGFGGDTVMDSSAADTGSRAPDGGMDMDGMSMDGIAPTSDAASQGDAGSGDVVQVMVGAGGLTFSPQAVSIHVGDTVEWVWSSGGHTVVSGASCKADDAFCNSNDTGCSSAPLLESGAKYRHTFAVRGTFPYFCRPHCQSGMTGTVTVQ